MFKFKKFCDINILDIEKPNDKFPKYIIWFPRKSYMAIPCESIYEVEYNIKSLPIAIEFFIFPVEQYTLKSIADLYEYDSSN